MKTGKLSVSVTERSVLRPMQLASPRFRGLSADGLSAAGGTVQSSGISLLRHDFSADLLFDRVMNRLYAAGAVPQSLSVNCIWPAEREEAEMAVLAGKLAQRCGEAGILPGAVFFTAEEGIPAPVLSLTAAGSVRAQKVTADSGKRTGYTQEHFIVAAGHAGLSGIAILASAEEERLSKRFTGSFLKQAKDFSLEQSLSWWSGEEEAVPAGEGGFFAALWALAEYTGCGFDVEQLKLPIRQETVEICEVLGLNPYLLASDGALLILTKDPERLLNSLEELNRDGAVIGHLVPGKAKILRRGEEVRYLYKPAQDELTRFLESPHRMD